MVVGDLEGCIAFRMGKTFASLMSFVKKPKKLSTSRSCIQQTQGIVVTKSRCTFCLLFS